MNGSESLEIRSCKITEDLMQTRQSLMPLRVFYAGTHGAGGYSIFRGESHSVFCSDTNKLLSAAVID
jgi:hypothetical protein